MTIREYGRYDAAEMLPLYESVGWTNYTRRPEMLRAAYENSLLVLAAYEDDALLGVLRAVGDGCSIVFIQDILVYPQHQRKGVGTALLRGALTRYEDVYQIELLTDDTPKTAAFYESMGLTNAADIGCLAFVRM